MHRIVAVSGIAVLAFSAFPVRAFDMPETKVTMEQCLKAALAVKSGQVRKLELETEDGKLVYEFDIRTKEGYTWELECDAMTGAIVETERNASSSDPEWKKNAKLLAKQAREIAVKAHPGKVKGTERELWGDGRAVWEVEIIEADGRELEVHVDARTGEILSAEHESSEKTIYRIGTK